MERILNRVKALAGKNRYEISKGVFRYRLDKDTKMALSSIARGLDTLHYEELDGTHKVSGKEFFRMQQANGFSTEGVDLESNYDVPVLKKISISHGRSVDSDLNVDKDVCYSSRLYSEFQLYGYEGIVVWLEEFKKRLSRCKKDFPHYYHLLDRSSIQDVKGMVKAMKSHSEYCLIRLRLN